MSTVYLLEKRPMPLRPGNCAYTARSEPFHLNCIRIQLLTVAVMAEVLLPKTVDGILDRKVATVDGVAVIRCAEKFEDHSVLGDSRGEVYSLFV